ncbi:hypothetical protein SLEP1_g25724 [Rubroshorea leprosula]|uniref:Uncharacterized protein n=1 Tax=Rubroshorea leprosula TaxID=152421 RepID=A0AAV5JR31_9ROSI|nr:hypothetical protein SLEP1_g25724 [Rubroshorea leprosula]
MTVNQQRNKTKNPGGFEEATAGFERTQASWVRTNPGVLGSTEPRRGITLERVENSPCHLVVHRLEQPIHLIIYFALTHSGTCSGAIVEDAFNVGRSSQCY